MVPAENKGSAAYCPLCAANIGWCYAKLGSEEFNEEQIQHFLVHDCPRDPDPEWRLRKLAEQRDD